MSPGSSAARQASGFRPPGARSWALLMPVAQKRDPPSLALEFRECRPRPCAGSGSSLLKPKKGNTAQLDKPSPVTVEGPMIPVLSTNQAR